MPRTARITNVTDYYHVMMRGIDRRSLFEDTHDFIIYRDKLFKYATECNITLFAYCLMSNHIHIALKVNDKSLDQFAKKLNVSYAQYFNNIYQRTGPVFQDRFKSELILTEQQLMKTIRYIHLNPVKAGLCKDPEDYDFSSLVDYMYSVPNSPVCFDNISNMHENAADLLRFTAVDDDFNCMDIDSSYQRSQYTDQELIRMMKIWFPDTDRESIIKMNKEDRYKLIYELRQKHISINQICRVTGFTKGIVQKVKR